MNQIIFWMRLAVLVWMLFLEGSLAWAQAPIYRCGKAYQAEPCDDGKLVDTRPQMSAPDDGIDMGTIDLCEGYNGVTFWTNTNCYGYRTQAMLKRTVKVPRNLSWDDKVAIAAGARRQADALQSAPRGPAIHREPESHRPGAWGIPLQHPRRQPLGDVLAASTNVAAPGQFN